jgi:ABC-type Fe3+/spermidine/putrescine transport system ATPase subunit
VSRLELADLSLRRGGVTWLEVGGERPLTIEDGELFGVAGRDGSGKTTLARVIAGLETPDEGIVRLGARALNGVPPERRGVGLVWDDDEPWLGRSVAENVEFGLRCRGVPVRARRMRVGEVLPTLGLDGLDRVAVGTLGPLQRWAVCLGRALALEPELLIIDEPFDRLPERERDPTRELIRRVHDEQRVTTLVLSRRVSQLLALADRLAILAGGRVSQVGPPSDLYTRPASLEVAQLLGPCNVLPGQVEAVDPRGAVVVRTSVGRLMGRSRVGALIVGDAAHVLLRAESLGVGSTTAASTNRFTAVLRRRHFLGTFCRLDLEAAGGWTGTAIALPTAALSLREGQSLTVSVPSEWVVVLPS